MEIFDTKWCIPSRIHCGVVGGVSFISMYAFSNFSKNSAEVCFLEKSSRLGENGIDQISQNNFLSLVVSFQPVQIVLVHSKTCHRANTNRRKRQVVAVCLPLGNSVPACEKNFLHNILGKKGLQVDFLLVLDRTDRMLHPEYEVGGAPAGTTLIQRASGHFLS